MSFFKCPADEGGEGMSNIVHNFRLVAPGLLAQCSPVHSGQSPISIKRLHPLWFGYWRKSAGIPLPIHNYLLISCFVSAMVTKANEMNKRQEEKRVLCETGCEGPNSTPIIAHYSLAEWYVQPESLSSLTIKERTSKD